MGSKNRIAKDILPIILKDRGVNDYFVDVFAGGMNLIDKVKGKRVANDKNKYLIAMWEGLKNNRSRPYEISRELYNCARDVYKGRETTSNHNINMDDFIVGWIGFMASYNGRFFDGGYSGHCVGKTKRDYISEQIRNTEKQIESLKNVIFTSLDYKDIQFKHKNCVIYCDPPYRDTKQYDVSKNFNHSHFWNWCRDLANDGHKVFISEYNAPADFSCVWQKEINSPMSNVNEEKKPKAIEKLFTLK